MESSTVLAFRIFVMLACLIVVPLAAIFGSAFPDVVKTVLVDRIVALGTGKSPEPRSDSTGGGFHEVTPAGRANAPRGNANAWEAPRWGAAEATTAAGWQPSDTRASGAVVPLGTSAATYPADGAGASLAVATDSARGGPRVSPPNERGPYDPPTHHAYPDNAPAGQPPLSSSPSAGYDMAGGIAPRGLSGTQEQSDRFTSMERRLRELGATYYLLETLGQQSESYRFHCRMAVGNNPNYTRPFEATDRDALRAMSQVLEQVESWRASRPQ